MDSALIIGLLVLTAAATTLFLGDAIACLFSKQAGVVSHVGFWDERPVIVAGQGDGTASWSTEGISGPYTLMLFDGRQGQSSLDYATWESLGTYDAPPATGLTIPATGKVVVVAQASRCGMALSSPTWPAESSEPPRAPHYAAIEGYTSNGTDYYQVAAYDVAGERAWGRVLAGEDDTLPYLPVDVARSRDTVFVYGTSADEGATPGIYSLPMVGGGEAEPVLVSGRTTHTAADESLSVSDTDPSLTVNADGSLIFFRSDTGRPAVLTAKTGASRFMWSGGVTSVRVGRDNLLHAVNAAGTHLVRFTGKLGTPELTPIPASVTAAHAARPGSRLLLSAVDAQGRSYVTVDGTDRDFLISADGGIAIELPNPPAGVGRFGTSDSFNPEGTAVAVLDALSPPGTAGAALRPNSLFFRDNATPLKQALYAPPAGSTLPRVTDFASDSGTAGYEVLPSVVSTGPPIVEGSGGTVVAVGRGTNRYPALRDNCIAVSPDGGLSWTGAGGGDIFAGKDVFFDDFDRDAVGSDWVGYGRSPSLSTVTSGLDTSRILGGDGAGLIATTRSFRDFDARVTAAQIGMDSGLAFAFGIKDASNYYYLESAPYWANTTLYQVVGGVRVAVVASWSSSFCPGGNGLNSMSRLRVSVIDGVLRVSSETKGQSLSPVYLGSGYSGGGISGGLQGVGIGQASDEITVYYDDGDGVSESNLASDAGSQAETHTENFNGYANASPLSGGAWQDMTTGGAPGVGVVTKAGTDGTFSGTTAFYHQAKDLIAPAMGNAIVFIRTPGGLPLSAHTAGLFMQSPDAAGGGGRMELYYFGGASASLVLRHYASNGTTYRTVAAATPPFGSSTVANMALQKDGNRWYGYLNGVKLIDAHDDSHVSGVGRVGFLGRYTVIDDFTVTGMPAGGPVDAPPPVGAYDVAYGTPGGSPLWVAVGGNALAKNTVATSPDGVTWTGRGVPSDKVGTLRTVTWTGTKYIAGGEGRGDGYAILVSANGVDWEPRRVAGAGSYPTVNSVATNGTDYVAAMSGGGTGTSQTLARSADGESWNAVTGLFAFGPASYGGAMRVRWTGDRFIATSHRSSTGSVSAAQSPTGTTWTPLLYENSATASSTAGSLSAVERTKSRVVFGKGGSSSSGFLVSSDATSLASFTPRGPNSGVTPYLFARSSLLGYSGGGGVPVRDTEWTGTRLLAVGHVARDTDGAISQVNSGGSQSIVRSEDEGDSWLGTGNNVIDLAEGLGSDGFNPWVTLPDVVETVTPTPPQAILTVDYNNDGVYGDLESGVRGSVAHWKATVINSTGRTARLGLTDGTGHGFSTLTLADKANQTVLWDTIPTDGLVNTLRVADAESGNSASDDAEVRVLAIPVVAATARLDVITSVDYDGDNVFSSDEKAMLLSGAKWRTTVSNTGGTAATDVAVTDTDGHSWGPLTLGAGQKQTFTWDTVPPAKRTVTTTATASNCGAKTSQATVTPQSTPKTWHYAVIVDGVQIWGRDFAVDSGTRVYVNENSAGYTVGGQRPLVRTDGARYAVPTSSFNARSAREAFYSLPRNRAFTGWSVGTKTFAPGGGSYSDNAPLSSAAPTGGHKTEGWDWARSVKYHLSGDEDFRQAHVTALGDNGAAGPAGQVCIWKEFKYQSQARELNQAGSYGRIYWMHAEHLVPKTGLDAAAPGRGFTAMLPWTTGAEPDVAWYGGSSDHRMMTDMAFEVSGVTWTEGGVSKTMPNFIWVSGRDGDTGMASDKYPAVTAANRTKLMRLDASGNQSVVSAATNKVGRARSKFNVTVAITGGPVYTP